MTMALDRIAFDVERNVRPVHYEREFAQRDADHPDGLYTTSNFVSEVNDFWDGACSEYGIDPKNEVIENAGYLVCEIARTAFENEEAKGCKVSLDIEADAIRIVVEETIGVYDEEADIEVLEVGGGLSGAFESSSTFAIEINGKKFEKQPEENELVKTGDSEIATGSRVTFTIRIPHESRI